MDTFARAQCVVMMAPSSAVKLSDAKKSPTQLASGMNSINLPSDGFVGPAKNVAIPLKETTGTMNCASFAVMVVRCCAVKSALKLSISPA